MLSAEETDAFLVRGYFDTIPAGYFVVGLSVDREADPYILMRGFSVEHFHGDM